MYSLPSSLPMMLMVGLLLSPLMVYYVQKWEWALLGCILYIPISGYVSVMFDRNPLAIQAKDFLFLIPAYIGCALFLKSKIRFSGVPNGFTVAAISLIGLSIIQLMNPSPQSVGFLAGLLGIKIWVFYLPLVMLSYIFVSNPKNFRVLSRAIGISCWVPAGAGIAQYWASNVYGFEKTMKFWFGSEAKAVTMGFSAFSTEYGELYRLPSTFSFVTNYSFYLLAATCFVLIGTAIEQKRKWVLFNYITLFVLLVAGATCGARYMLFFQPITLFTFFFIKSGLGASLVAFLIIAIANMLASIFISFNPLDFARQFSPLIREYAFDFIPSVFTRAILNYPMGAGTGTATLQIRHLEKFTRNPGIFTEGFFSKGIIELGVPGLVILLFLVFTPILVSTRNLLRTPDRSIRAVLAGLIAYQLAVAVTSLKGNPLDQDPSNVFFWITVGIAFRINAYISSEQKALRDELTRELYHVGSGAAQPSPAAIPRAPSQQHTQRGV